MVSITIFVATMTGNAELIAEEICDELGDIATIEVRLMEQCHAQHLADAEHALIVSSTYGTGEVPDNGQPLFDEVSETRPDLSNLVYGVISLGDSTYRETFAFGGRHWDKLMASLGAKRSGDLLVLDASSDVEMEPVALDWARSWIEKLTSDE